MNIWVSTPFVKKARENIIESLIGMVFSIAENNHKNIQLKIRRVTFEAKHHKFREIFEKFSEVLIYETKKNYQIEIFINNLNELNKINNNYFYEQINQPNRQRNFYNKRIKNSLKTISIHEMYNFPDKVLKDKNLFFIEKSQLKYYLNDKSYFYSYQKNIHFFLKISDEKITSVKFHCDDLSIKILINFSKIILNTPLVEAFEHGVMKLENKFRKKNIKKKLTV